MIMERINITTVEDARPYDIRVSAQKWPRAGVKPVYTIKCPDCAQRHRLSNYPYTLVPGQGQRWMWGTVCHKQLTFEDDVLPEPPAYRS